MSTKGGPDIVRDGLVLYLDAANVKSYPGSGTVWEDLSGNENSGSLVNSPTFDSGSLGSFNFDGIDDYCVNSNFFISSDPIFTVIGWFKRTGSWAAKGPWGIGTNGNAISSYQNFGADRLGFDEWGSTTFYTSETIPLNIWTHITWVKQSSGIFNTSILNIYINTNITTLNTSRNNNVTANINNGVTIGKIAYDNALYTAPSEISNFKIYNRALTISEIQQNYNATKGRFGL